MLNPAAGGLHDVQCAYVSLQNTDTRGGLTTGMASSCQIGQPRHATPYKMSIVMNR